MKPLLIGVLLKFQDVFVSVMTNGKSLQDSYFQLFLAKNCTDDPYIPPGADKGLSNWTKPDPENGIEGNKTSYQTIVHYYCQKQGWGFPSTGKSEAWSICQADKSWNLTSVEDCICKITSTNSKGKVC